MKKVIFLSLLIAKLFSACDKKEYEAYIPIIPVEFAKNSKDSLAFNCENQNSYIAFKANYAWRAEVDEADAQWLTIVSTPENKPGEDTITFNIKKNQTNDHRIGHIKIHSGDTTYVFSIIQSVCWLDIHELILPFKFKQNIYSLEYRKSFFIPVFTS